MALKPRVKSKEEVSQEQLTFYVERYGAWLLDVEGGVADKAKLDEFRDNNLALKKELEDLKARFEGIDPAEVRKLAEEKRRLEEDKILAGGKAPHPEPLPSAERGASRRMSVPANANGK